MNAPNTKLYPAIILASLIMLLCGWAQAQSLNVPAGSVCKTVKTVFETDSKGRTVITTKKVCEVAK
jgi:hypothetical protein